MSVTVKLLRETRRWTEKERERDRERECMCEREKTITTSYNVTAAASRVG